MPAKMKPAKKSGPRPVTVKLPTTSLSHGTVFGVLDTLTQREISEHLRARGIGISKSKTECIERLLDHLFRDGATVSLSFT